MASIPRTGGGKATVLLYCRFYVLVVQLPQKFTSVNLLCTTTAKCSESNSTLQYILNSIPVLTTIARHTMCNSVIVITINFVIDIVTL